jgi:uncharacterized protein YabE (DUF348 family)
MQAKFIRLRKQYAIKQRRHVRRLKILGKHPISVPVYTFVVLVILGSAGFYVFGRPSTEKLHPSVVIVTDNGQSRIVPSVEPTVGKLLIKLNVKLNEGDVVEPERDTRIVQDNFRVNIYRAHPVEIQVDGHKTFAYSAASTPRSIAAQSGTTVYAEDAVVRRPVENFLAADAVTEQIVVTRSTPVNLNLFGTPAPSRTLSTTVGGLLQDKKISLRDGETVTPDASTPVTANMQIFILQKGVSIVSQQQPIAMSVQNIDDNTLTFGSQAIRQVGAPGVQVVTYQVKVDATGKEIGRTVIQAVETTPPVTQIVAIGKNVQIAADKTSIMAAVGLNPGDYQYADYIVSHEGGWSGATKSNYGGSGAYGICQALPGSKMASAGADWATNPVTQLRWCSGYATKYGGWAGAYDYWQAHRYW